ncbi:hypothetical protein [Massilia glaciei]|uniref:Uncharacterized protein n=1 Tax=Massilia glaciei TaxID=1524097 RepID=A0A2U2HG44_9BURK|nr:hypothetical protein [Massilia glaciei]PWF43688.1 hypothetical protein C7C56_020565 [Massilia glaciei]
MPSIAQWIKRFLLVGITVFLLLLVVNVIKGNHWQDAAQEALIWAAISAAVFVGAHYHRERKGLACALCDNLDAVGKRPEK